MAFPEVIFSYLWLIISYLLSYCHLYVVKYLDFLVSCINFYLCDFKQIL